MSTRAVGCLDRSSRMSHQERVLSRLTRSDSRRKSHASQHHELHALRSDLGSLTDDVQTLLKAEQGRAHVLGQILETLEGKEPPPSVSRPPVDTDQDAESGEPTNVHAWPRVPIETEKSNGPDTVTTAEVQPSDRHPAGAEASSSVGSPRRKTDARQARSSLVDGESIASASNPLPGPLPWPPLRPPPMPRVHLHVCASPGPRSRRGTVMLALAQFCTTGRCFSSCGSPTCWIPCCRSCKCSSSSRTG